MFENEETMYLKMSFTTEQQQGITGKDGKKEYVG